MRIIYSLSIVSILFFACNNPNNKQSNDKKENKKDTLAVEKDSLSQETILVELTKQLLNTLKNKNYSTFATYIHPDLGVRFSPYAHIDTVHDVILKRDEFLKKIKEGTPMSWGSYDGTGEEIELRPAAYFQKFVYDKDFLHAEKTTVNQSSANGNSLNNLSEVYPHGEYTESYFSGFDKKYNGMDWRALRLVYEKEGEQYYLVGIIHDQWTI